MDSTLSDSVLGTLAEDVPLWLGTTASPVVASVLFASFGIVVGFVAFKLIKRALNKA